MRIRLEHEGGTEQFDKIHQKSFFFKKRSNQLFSYNMFICYSRTLNHSTTSTFLLFFVPK